MFAFLSASGADSVISSSFLSADIGVYLKNIFLFGVQLKFYVMTE